MRHLRYLVEFLLFLVGYFAVFVAYQLPEMPTKFIYFNF